MAPIGGGALLLSGPYLLNPPQTEQDVGPTPEATSETGSLLSNESDGSRESGMGNVPGG